MAIIWDLGSLVSSEMNISINSDEIESVKGSYGAMWHRMEVSLDSTAAYRIIIQANIGDGSAGDIAIDDITFTPGCVFFDQ